ncbi:MAG: NAD-dependent epimerase/dehydratase family protein [Bacteroidetes bacterium]|nr:NAD-dependent epimerase/dehydratase family protein [Bacteroidota bacterium]
MTVHTILGAGGVIADTLAAELLAHQLPVRLVSRNPVIPGAISASAATTATAAGARPITTFSADLTHPEPTLKAIEGSAVVYLCVGLPYRYSIWRQQWPRIIDNTIEACKRTGAKLIFFDNVYMYGRTDGPMTEETPYDPSSRKGDLRARLATQLMSEVRKGNITAMIARSADFYGPGAGRTSIPDILVFQKLQQGKKAQWLVNARVPHSFTYTPDAARAMYLLATDPGAYNQVWHLPTAGSPLTGARFIEKAAASLGRPAGYSILSKWMIRLGGLFDGTTKELNEMPYQYEFDYLFDSSKFEQAYNFQPTSYEEGIKATANAYKNGTGF